ncbi:Homeodomain-like protein [Apiospora phragmitis]|uniref:Homeodomain-like protein n=1 Tax=Apiospora phragmitis TaxID=2905665 RepID=A0ABR1X6S8_9PEZI
MSAMDVTNDPDDSTVSIESPKERHSLTLDQRRALRRWAHSQTTRPSHKACIEWFYSQFGQSISQSTISHSLSPKYARLDNDSQFSGSRLRFGNWPDVEKLVLLWHGQVVSSKRYGLLIRRQRRHGSAPNPADDIPYLVDAVPRFMTINQETSPAAIRDAVMRVVGVEASLGTCARVRDEIVRRIENPVVLQNALRALQQEEADAEAEAAAAREERERQESGLPPIAGLSTPGHAPPPQPGPPRSGAGARFTPQAPDELTLTPISSGGPISQSDRPLRCPFCVNHRMLRTIKEAVEHMSTHVVV